MMAERLRPGDEVKVAGQYIVVDRYGKRVPGTAEYTLAAGDKAPPTPEKGMAFVLVDRSQRAADMHQPAGFAGRLRTIRQVPQPQRGFTGGES